MLTGRSGSTAVGKSRFDRSDVFMIDKFREMQQQKEELERLLTARERYIQDLRNSFSWRLTAPLRWLNNRLFRFGINKGRLSKSTASDPYSVNTNLESLLMQVGGARISRTTSDRAPLSSVRETINFLIACRKEFAGSVIALLDHDLGGGANYYSDALANRFVAASYRVLHIKMNPDTGRVSIHLRSTDLSQVVVIDTSSMVQLDRLLDLFSVEMIIVNELVGWPEPLEQFRLLARGRLPYAVLLHDYFPICPNWNLLDAGGHYCCLCNDELLAQRCLSRNISSGAYTLYGDTYADIKLWRESAAAYLTAARAVVCFSEASRRILTEAFSWLTNPVVIEHSVSFPGVGNGMVRKLTGGVLRVGVVGCSSLGKGAGILASLLKCSALSDLPVVLTILGETAELDLPKQQSARQVVFHGRYRREEMAQLVERYHIQVVLIPSILPETFSYTVSESLLLGCPVICFDLGAQAERVRRFNCGVIVPEASADALIDTFTSLLTNPEQVEAMSRNALRYLPPTEDEHFAEIFRVTGLSAGE